MWRDTSEDMHSAYANEMTQLMQEHYKSLKGKNSWSELFDKFHYSSMVDLYWIFGLIFIEYLVWSLLHIWFDLYCIFGSIFIAYLVWSSLHIWFDLYCIFGSIFIGYLVWSLLDIWFDLYWKFSKIAKGWIIPEYSTCVRLRSLNQYWCQYIQTKLIKSELIHWTFLYVRWSSAHQVGHVGFLQVLWFPPTRRPHKRSHRWQHACLI